MVPGDSSRTSGASRPDRSVGKRRLNFELGRQLSRDGHRKRGASVIRPTKARQKSRATSKKFQPTPDFSFFGGGDSRLDRSAVDQGSSSPPGTLVDRILRIDPPLRPARIQPLEPIRPHPFPAQLPPRDPPLVRSPLEAVEIPDPHHHVGDVARSDGSTRG